MRQTVGLVACLIEMAGLDWPVPDYPSRQGDSPSRPELLAQIPEDEEIGSITADGAYDTTQCHNPFIDQGAEVRIPIRRNGA